MNVYNILEPCYHGTEMWKKAVANNIRLPSSFRQLGETDKPLPVRTRLFGRAWPFRAPVREGRVPTWPEILMSDTVPCVVSNFDYIISKSYIDYLIYSN